MMRNDRIRIFLVANLEGLHFTGVRDNAQNKVLGRSYLLWLPAIYPSIY